MKTVFKTQPDYLQVLTLEQAKQQLRIPMAIDDEDDIHEAMIIAAGDAISQQSGRVLGPCEIEIYLDGKDLADIVYLPWSPIEITEVAVKNDAGVYVATTEYEASTAGITPRIKFTGLGSRTGMDVVRITADAGFAQGEVPPGLLHAMRLLVVHYDENRSETIVPVPARVIPKGVDNLINPHRNVFML